MRVVDFGSLLASCCDLEGMNIQVEHNDEFVSPWLLSQAVRWMPARSLTSAQIRHNRQQRKIANLPEFVLF